MMNTLPIFPVIPLSAAIAVLVSMPSEAIEEAQYLTILHTNDHHGRFWHNERGEYGMAARKTLIDQIRAEVEQAGGHVLLLSGGDINTGVPESDMFDAEPDFKGMTLLGYDAMAVGNHEFDNVLDVIRQQQRWADFPFLSANTYNEQGERLFEPYHIFHEGELDVAVIGLTTHTTALIGNKEFTKGIEFTLPEQETASLIEELRDSADLVIALTHLGHSSMDIGTDVALARSVDGLDMIVGGHSTEVICMEISGKKITNYRPGMPCTPDKVNGTWIVQAEGWGRYLGRADLKITGDDVELVNYQLIPVNLLDEQGELVTQQIEPDAEALVLLRPFQLAGGQALNEVIGRSEGFFSRKNNLNAPNPSPMGCLITRAMLNATQADIALFNFGGIRSEIYAGDILKRTLLQVQPFRNRLVETTFSGEELLDYFEAIHLLPDNKMKIQFSGLFFDAQGTLRLSASKQSIDPQGSYRVVLNNYMAEGGEGFPELTHRQSYIDTGIVDYQALMRYVTSHSPIRPQDFLPQ